MTNLADFDALQKHSTLFSLLSESGRTRLWDVAREVSFRPGETLMTEGATGSNFHVITEGSVRVTIDDFGRDKEVARLGRGAFVGEMAAIMMEPRSATVVAVDDVSTLEFDGARVEDLLREFPKVREALVKLALKRSEDNLQQLMSMDISGEGALVEQD